MMVISFGLPYFVIYKTSHTLHAPFLSDFQIRSVCVHKQLLAHPSLALECPTLFT